MSKIRRTGFVQVLVACLGMGVAACPASVWAAPAAQGGGAKVEAAKVKATPKKSAKPAKPEAAPGEPVFAMVNGKPVTVRAYQGLLAETMRGRFYHGTIPEGEAEALHKEVADRLVDRELLVAEAEKRGLRPDPARFEKTLADIDARYAADPKWKEQRDSLLPQIKANMDRQSLLEQIEQAVRDVAQPAPDEVRAYYDRRPDLFTEPERLSLSIILLKVDPGATKEEWDRVREEAQKIFGRIKDAADFAQQARLHSQHDSAANGGYMGYLHGGMMPRGMEDKIVLSQVGVVNEPTTTLEGIVVYRVEDRIPAKLREFQAVEKRAQDLLLRDRAEEAWQKTLSRLRAGARIEIVTPQVPVGK